MGEAEANDSPWSGWRPFRSARHGMPELRGLNAAQRVRTFKRAEAGAWGGWFREVRALVGGAVAAGLPLLALRHRWLDGLGFLIVVLPCGVAIGLLEEWLAYPLLRRRVRAELGTHCPGCDYDLRHAEGRCPECGRAVRPRPKSMPDEVGP